LSGFPVFTKGVRDVFRRSFSGDPIQAQNVSDSNAIRVAFHRSSQTHLGIPSCKAKSGMSFFIFYFYGCGIHP
jgi:hypothetical protein